MTEKEKMLAGLLYDCTDDELMELRTKAHILCKDYNDTYETDTNERKEIIKQLLPNSSQNIYLQGPIQFDYGVFTSFGENCYANFNFIVLDCCPVNVGNNVLFGPNCTLATPIHPYILKNEELLLLPTVEIQSMSMQNRLKSEMTVGLPQTLPCAAV